MNNNLIQITDNIFQIILTHNNTRPSNVYLINKDKKILVDTGHPFQDSILLLKKALMELSLGFRDIDYIIYTHPHIDHVGGGLILRKHYKRIKHIAHINAKYYLKYFNSTYNELLDLSKKFVDFKGLGAPDDVIQAAKHYIDTHYLLDQDLRVTTDQTIKDGDILKLGQTELHIYYTPSHSFCDISLYEPEEKILFSGDFILENGTTLLSILGGATVEEGLLSLKKVQGLDIDLILSGHGNKIVHPYKSIERSKRYYQKTRSKILQILRQDKRTVSEIVFYVLNGNISADNHLSWYRLLLIVNTHLDQLLKENKIIALARNNKIYYDISS